MEREQEVEEQIQETTTQPAETSTVNPPVTQPVSPSIDTDTRSLYLTVLREKEQENERLRRELEQKSKPEPKPITPEDNQRFFAEPLSATRELVQNELREALAPLMGFVQGYQKESVYSRLKAGMKQHPVFGKLITPDVEQYVDQVMQGAEPTEANFQAAILQVQGLKAAGLLQTAPVTGPVNNPPVPNQQVVTSPTQTATIVNPPHLRPSAPAAPRLEENSQPKRPLTENEKRLAREWGMTEDEYRAGQAEGTLVLEPETTPRRKKQEEK